MKDLINDNISELTKAQWRLNAAERACKYPQLVGALAALVDAKTWAQALNTTYGYIREIEEAACTTQK